MKDNREEILLDIAKKVVWFQNPEKTIKNKDEFLAYLMVYGFDDDVYLSMQYFSLDDFKEALKHSPIGLFDSKSWAFWHYALGFNNIPPLPKRILFTAEEISTISKWRI